MSFSSLAISASARAGKQSEKNADIIEFVEAPWGLKMTLFPVQRVILKAHYGLELDDTKTFEISDWRRENIEVHTEKSYLKKLYDEGRCNVGEVIPGKQRREMILSIGRRSGKCVVGNTLVQTDRGLVRIDSLGDTEGAEFQPLSVCVSQEAGKISRSAYFYNGGFKKTKYFKTKSGFVLEGTGNHRIKVLTPDFEIKWKFLQDISEGDVACINRSNQLFPKRCVDLRKYKEDLNVVDILPDFLDEKWGELLGILVGDGLWTDAIRVRVSVGCSSFEKYLLSFFREIFGKVSYTPDKRSETAGMVTASGVDLRTFLDRMGWLIKVKTTTKEVPHTILSSPKSVQCAFLKGLFETDGCVSGKSISLSTTSSELARQVQLILLNLGIVSSRNSYDRPEKKQWETEWRVSIKGVRSKRLFSQLIGFLSERKKSLLEDLSKKLAHLEVREGVKGLDKTLRNELGKQKKVLGKTPKLLTPYWKIQEILPLLKGSLKTKCEALLDADYFFDPVVEVRDSESLVYDLNVPDGASFLGNGFTNHNTTISACIAAYETYKLIKKGDPQKYYGLPSSNNIQIISVATDKDQAGLLYQEVSGHYRNCSFFGPYTANNTLSYARFQTPADVEKYGRYIENASAKATLKVTFRSCVAKGLRGAGNICVILDEVAHFTESGQSGAEEVYNAVVPSTSAYSPKDPNNPTVPIGEVQGRVILISSPLGKQGLFYNLFQIGMRGGKASENILAVQAPTWEVNPTVPAEEFEKHYLKNAAVFFTEYGGEFTDRTRGWIEKSEDLFACVDVALKARMKGPARKPHFMGIDLGLVGDGTAVAIGHLEEDLIVVDLVTQIKAGEGDYEDKERLDFDDVADWILGLTKKFYIVEGIFDQWAGIPLEQALAKRGLGQMKSIQMTKQLTSQIFQNFKDMMWDERLSLYDRPNPEEDGHEPYIQELLELQAKVQSKHIITVEAPQVQGKHDDMSDALTRMVWVASKQIGKQRYFAGGASGRSSMSGYNSGKGFAGGTRLRGGSDPRRIAPRTSRRSDKHSIRNRILGNKKR